MHIELYEQVCGDEGWKRGERLLLPTDNLVIRPIFNGCEVFYTSGHNIKYYVCESYADIRGLLMNAENNQPSRFWGKYTGWNQLC